MEHPTEKRAINKKLREIGQTYDRFNRSDCYDFFPLGQHLSFDWQECIDAMVKSGELIAHDDGKYSLKRRLNNEKR